MWKKKAGTSLFEIHGYVDCYPFRLNHVNIKETQLQQIQQSYVYVEM